MKKYIGIILNFPISIPGFIGALLSGPKRVAFSKKPFAIIFYVRNFWWWQWLPGQKGVRGMANGWVVQLGPHELPGDLEHELVHVEQAERAPFIHFFKYWLENRRMGYRANKYEVEAYDRAGNWYKKAE